MATHEEPATPATEAAEASTIPVTPILGYTRPSGLQLSTVNMNKAIEEDILSRMDILEQHSELDVDRRWLAVARTHIEQGFMALNRAVMKPKRLGE
jgi:hypothetical protein